MNQLEKLLKVLSKRGPVVVMEEGKSFRCVCPGHSDVGPSLGVSAGDGKILMRCFAGCRTERLLATIGWSMKDLFDDAIGLSGNYVPRTFKRTALTPAEVDYRGVAYDLLLKTLELSTKHREALRKRGLSDEVIDRNQYRSLDSVRAVRAADAIVQALGPEAFSRVPGLIRTRYTQTPALALQYGMLVPVRHPLGTIVAFQVRTPDPVRKYVWLSGGAVSFGTLAHCPLDSVKYQGMPLRVTEGPLKADIACALDPTIPTIGVAGLTLGGDVLSLLPAYAPSEVRAAFDADVWLDGHDQQADAVRRFMTSVKKLGHAVTCEIWDVKDGKGIDDLLSGGKRPLVIEETEVDLGDDPVTGDI